MVEKHTKARRRQSSTSEVSVPPAIVSSTTGNGVVTKAERRGSPQPVGKPHRITYDCTATRYRQLKLASMNTGDSMNAIISLAIDDWLAAHPEVLEI